MAAAEDLDALLAACGLGRWQAAEAAGVSPTSVRDWCSGRRLPRNEQAAKLAAALKVPVARVLAAAARSGSAGKKRARK